MDSDTCGPAVWTDLETAGTVLGSYRRRVICFQRKPRITKLAVCRSVERAASIGSINRDDNAELLTAPSFISQTGFESRARAILKNLMCLP
jgi:hypothetical protein